MQPRQAPHHHCLEQRSNAAPALETATEGSRRRRTARALPGDASGGGERRERHGGTGSSPQGRPGAARRGRTGAGQEEGRPRLEIRREERAGEDGAGLRDGWREDAGGVPDLRLAGPEVDGGGRSASGGGGLALARAASLSRSGSEGVYY
ncbi:hypothetical protein ZWY2020_049982 [Hordeum vulgare]|nr:hypothetical protein ZWY2020_049982 [Hordeum vulgare]